MEGRLHVWSVSQTELGAYMAILTYFHVVRSRRHRVELVSNNMMCLSIVFPRQFSYSSLRHCSGSSARWQRLAARQLSSSTLGT